MGWGTPFYSPKLVLFIDSGCWLWFNVWIKFILVLNPRDLFVLVVSCFLNFAVLLSVFSDCYLMPDKDRSSLGFFPIPVVKVGLRRVCGLLAVFDDSLMPNSGQVFVKVAG